MRTYDHHARRGFTLIELLVVIGLIGILLAILLPALGSARRRAQTIACAAALRELAHAFTAYANEHNGCYPVAYLQPRNPLTYSIADTDFTHSRHAHWINFIAKYVTRTKQGLAAQTAQERIDARRAVTWACPNRYVPQSDLWITNTGFGMNFSPTFSVSLPPGIDNPPHPYNTLAPWPTLYVNDYPDYPWSWKPAGQFFKATHYTRPCERMLLTDSGWNIVTSRAPPPDGSFPPQLVIDETIWTMNLPGQTLVDLYRHGRRPPVIPPAGPHGPPLFSPTGGRVGFNIVYCDGHVETHDNAAAAYRSIRMRYPG